MEAEHQETPESWSPPRATDEVPTIPNRNHVTNKPGPDSTREREEVGGGRVSIALQKPKAFSPSLPFLSCTHDLFNVLKNLLVVSSPAVGLATLLF